MSNFFSRETSTELQQKEWWLPYVGDKPSLDEYKRQNNLWEYPRSEVVMKIERNEIFPPAQIEDARVKSDFYVVSFDEKRMAFCRLTEDN